MQAVPAANVAHADPATAVGGSRLLAELHATEFANFYFVDIFMQLLHEGIESAVRLIRNLTVSRPPTTYNDRPSFAESPFGSHISWLEVTFAATANGTRSPCCRPEVAASATNARSLSTLKLVNIRTMQ